MKERLSRSAGVLGTLQVPLGLGLLRLSTEGRPPLKEALALIHHAFEHGFRLLDTAESYGLNHKDLHYGEQLARKAVESWSGSAEEIKILTKVGMARPKGRWSPAGSPKDIRKGVEGSLKALGVERLFLVQLHVKDFRVPFEETLQALAQLRRDGKIEHIGLCNMGPLEVRQAQRLFPIVTLQNELSVLSRASARNGMLQMAQDMEIPFLAHRPLGGYAKTDQLLKNRALKPVTERREESVHELALAYLLQSASHVVPLVGATRKESIDSCMRALQIDFESEEIEQLKKKFSFQANPDALKQIAPRVTPSNLPVLEPHVGPGDQGEVVLLTGIQGAGKSEMVEAYLKKGYVRLNRDVMGGSLDDVVESLRDLLEEGVQRVVLDNTYPTRISRSPVITVAHEYGLPVRCRRLNTTLADARINLVLRILQRYDRLLGPAEMKELGKTDSNLPPPGAMRQYTNSFEPPQLDEGFSAVDEVAFRRRSQPELVNKGLFLDVDGTLRVTKSGEKYPRHPDDVELLPGRREVLQEWVDKGYSLFFLSNQSGVHSGKLQASQAEAAFERTVDLLDLPVEEVVFCPHGAFPLGCYCRKPMPGMGVYLIRKYKLDPTHLLMVGDMSSDSAFAEGLGIEYRDSETFFHSRTEKINFEG